MLAEKSAVLVEISASTADFFNPFAHIPHRYAELPYLKGAAPPECFRNEIRLVAVPCKSFIFFRTTDQRCTSDKKTPH